MDQIEKKALQDAIERHRKWKESGANPISFYRIPPDCTMQQYTNAVDAFFTTWQSGDRFTFRRELIGRSIAWIFEFDGREIGRLAIAPLKDGGFRISERSKAEGDERRYWAGFRGDLKWEVEGYLGMRPPGIRISHHLQPPALDEPFKPGPKPESRAAKVAAWHEWKNRTGEVAQLTLVAWLEFKWGSNSDGILKVPKSTFYSWPRR